MTDSGDQSGRITLVTGASRGIGRATALAVAKAGGHVIAFARTQGALEELDDAIRAVGGGCTLVPGDLTDGDGIDRLGGAVHERWGRVDGLVAAGAMLGPITPAGNLSPKEWDKAVAVNLTSVYRLIRSFDPLLRASSAGRAVFVTSRAATAPRAYWGAYAATKSGLDGLVKAYAAEFENAPARVNLFDPGPTRTGMRAAAMPGEDPTTLPSAEDRAERILSLLSPNETRNGQVIVAPRHDEPAQAD